MKPSPLCSVILITWNRRRELEMALNSVYSQTISDRLEVIVIDNGSTDGTIEWLQNEYLHPIRLFAFEKNEGACHARNAGINLATAPAICFLDSDALLLDDNCIEACLARVAGGQAHVASCSIWFDRAHTKVFAHGGYITPEGHFWGRRTRTEWNDPDFISTCFAVWDSRLLCHLGGFNPWYHWGIEDMDLALRAKFRNRIDKDGKPITFEVLTTVNALHEMSQKGRHYSPHDFDAAFHAIERQRLFLVLSLGGIGAFFRVLLTQCFHIKRIETEAWEQVLPLKKRLYALAVYPLLRVLRLPLDYPTINRNHLENAPMPTALDQRRSSHE